MRRLFAFLPAALLLGACTFGAMPSPEPEEPGRVSGEKLISGPGEPEMEPEARINNLLQNAKAEYDDRHFEASHRFAEQAERLDREKLKGTRYIPMALNIQAYCLLQLGLIDDYQPQGQPSGTVRGAMTKFSQVLEMKPRDFRALLGYALCKFRRHAVNIGKSEKLGEGMLVLANVGTLVNEAVRAGSQDRARQSELYREAHENVKVFAHGRTRLLELKEIFRDPHTKRIDPRTRKLIEAAWLGTLDESKEELAVNDLLWILDDARKSGDLPTEDLATFNAALGGLEQSWGAVRAYWRKAALADIQASRDTLLGLRDENAKANPENARYFWIDRDLAFVFTSLGGFFLDYCLEELNLRGLREGVKMSDLGKFSARKFTEAAYKSDAKHKSRENYVAAQSFYESFIKRHEEFEKLRLGKAGTVNFDDVTANPFLVDLVSRYKSEMFEAVQEERLLRKSMLLQLCALAVDPIYQVNDLEKAKVYANQLRSMDPRNPIHFFVRATACFEQGEFQEALTEYEAYMKVSSIVEDANLRKHVRERMEQCRRNLPKSSGASGN